MATLYEEIKVQSAELVDKVKDVIHEGNVQRIIIKDDKGHTFLEIPLTVAAVGVIVAPMLAVLGALAALVGHFRLVIERSAPPETATPVNPEPPPPAH